MSKKNKTSKSVFRASLTENKMQAFIRRFLMHYGIYRRYPLGRFSALRNARRIAHSWREPSATNVVVLRMH